MGEIANRLRDKMILYIGKGSKNLYLDTPEKDLMDRVLKKCERTGKPACIRLKGKIGMEFKEMFNYDQEYVYFGGKPLVTSNIPEYRLRKHLKGVPPHLKGLATSYLDGGKQN
ncbi:hypothetical protein ACFLZZ_01755 [Nanoarchaeota archaeon]